jgi:hypothetical protein
MLRTKCIWCGKTVRGGDDWAGRTGKCPHCDAEIIFPRLDGPPTEPAPAKPFEFIDPHNYFNSNGWAAVALIGVCGISAWTWVRLIIFLAYGFWPYRMGLRVAGMSKVYGVALNNGDQLDFYWFLIFVSGFLTTWMLLIRGANYLVEHHRPRVAAIALIVLAGVATWISLIWQAMPARYRFTFHFPAGSARQGFFSLLVVFAVGGMVMWRDWKTWRETADVVGRPAEDDRNE